MQKIWTAEFANDKVTLSQEGRTLTIPISALEEWFVADLKSGHCCGGCRDLPFHGYGYESKKYSWCQFSREVANLYFQGWKWNRNRKTYLAIIGQYSYEKNPPASSIQQEHIIFKTDEKKLAQKIKRFENEILSTVTEEWCAKTGLSAEDCPYALGYLPEGFVEEPIRDMVLVTDDLTVYTIGVKTM